MDFRKEKIKEYFKNWVIERGSHHLKIIKFLKDHKDLSDTNTKDKSTGPVTLNGKRRCAEAKTIHGRETRAIRNVRAEKLAELKFYFKMLP